MQPRLRLDLSAGDLAYALCTAARPLDRARLERSIEARFGGDDVAGALVTLSARSALDAALGALALPAGSEILCSGLNVPDMARVIEEHGLGCVPVDLDLATLLPKRRALERRTSTRTRALLVAHLFGGRAPVDGLFRYARERGWFVIEDAAQAFTGSDFRGSRTADLTLFSFGPIKTATALGTGIARVRDPELLARMRALTAAWPIRPRSSFVRRALKFTALLALTRPTLYGLLVRRLERQGDLDAKLAGLVRGFPPERLFASLRGRPSAPQLALLERRLERFDAERLAQRRARGERLDGQLAGAIEIPGIDALDRTHWVAPILVGEPASLATRLRSEGFDSTTRATLGALRSTRAPHEGAPAAERFVRSVLYLPNGPELTSAELDRMAAVVLDAALARGDPD